MTLQDAKLLLDATTLPNEAESQDEALLRAREMMLNDPELAEWIAHRCAFDESVARAITNIPVPAGLRERILQNAGKPKTQGTSWMLLALSLAAALVVGWFGLGIFSPAPAAISKWESDSLVTAGLLNDAKMTLDQPNNDLAQIKRFLAEAGSPVPGDLPRNLTPNKSLGCKTFKADGHPATIVCFELASGVAAHLVVLDVPPSASKVPVGVPKFTKHGEWQIASWSDGHQTYMIGTRASMKDLKRLFT